MPLDDKLMANLLRQLTNIRRFGYQPMYNGRPSCPFCENFVDYEETHTATCILLKLEKIFEFGGEQYKTYLIG